MSDESKKPTGGTANTNMGDLKKVKGFAMEIPPSPKKPAVQPSDNNNGNNNSNDKK